MNLAMFYFLISDRNHGNARFLGLETGAIECTLNASTPEPIQEES